MPRESAMQNLRREWVLQLLYSLHNDKRAMATEPFNPLPSPTYMDCDRIGHLNSNHKRTSLNHKTLEFSALNLRIYISTAGDSMQPCLAGLCFVTDLCCAGLCFSTGSCSVTSTGPLRSVDSILLSFAKISRSCDLYSNFLKFDAGPQATQRHPMQLQMCRFFWGFSVLRLLG